MADYYYLHETPQILYTVETKPPPADTSKAVFRANSPAGKTLHTEPALKKSGSGTIPFPLEPKGIKLGDSPIFVEFTFEKQGAKPPTIKRLVVLALAEPAVRAIEAPPEADPGEQVKLVVSAWSARVFEKPNAVTLWPEEQPGRIAGADRMKVRWRLAGKDLTVQGEKIRTGGITKEHLGTYVEAQAWLGEKPDPALHATASIAVPKLEVTGPDVIPVTEIVAVEARIEPAIEGTYEWKIDAGERAVLADASLSACSVEGVAESEQTGDVKVTCTFTSKATGRKYTLDHALTVLVPPIEWDGDIDADAPLVFESEPEAEEPIAFETVPEADELELETVPEADDPLEIETEHESEEPIAFETEPESDAPIELETSPDVDDPLEVSASGEDEAFELECSEDADGIEWSMESDADSPLEIDLAS
ncbi:MAG TPA: hypothetical protein VFF73_28655 [Planctomycetota bacterium]|nr:hypothetical protein [Planctomycetota bacterium]